MAPKIGAHVIQNCTLDDSCGDLGDLCVSVVPSRNARFHYSFKHTTAKWLLSCFRACQNRVTYITCRSAATVGEFRGGIFTPRAGLLHPRIRCWSLFYPTHHCHLRRRHRLCFVFAIIWLVAILLLVSSLGSSSLLPSSASSSISL